MSNSQVPQYTDIRTGRVIFLRSSTKTKALHKKDSCFNTSLSTHIHTQPLLPWPVCSPDSLGHAQEGRGPCGRAGMCMQQHCRQRGCPVCQCVPQLRGPMAHPQPLEGSHWLRVPHCHRSGIAREPALPPPWYFCNEYHHCHLRGTCLRNLTTLIQWAQIAKECLCISVKSEIRGGGALSVKGQPQGAARADSGKLDCI